MPIGKACQNSGISYPRMLTYLESGEITGTQVDGEWSVQESSVDSWMATHRVASEDLTGITLDREERDRIEILQQVLNLRCWSIASLAKKLQVTPQAVQRWSVVGVPDRFVPVLEELLAATDALADTKRLADQLIGLPEGRAWSIVNATDREWDDITGESRGTLDLRTRRIRVSIKGGVIRTASGG